MILTELEMKWMRELATSYNNEESHLIYLLGESNRGLGKTTVIEKFSELLGIEIYQRGNIEGLRDKQIDYMLVDDNTSNEESRKIADMGIKVLGFCSI